MTATAARTTALLILANGVGGGPALREGVEGATQFREAVEQVCIELAKGMARDGEGATKLIEVKVVGAKSLADARVAARTVAGSPLVKSAVYGNDPNWGRVLAAVAPQRRGRRRERGPASSGRAFACSSRPAAAVR